MSSTQVLVRTKGERENNTSQKKNSSAAIRNGLRDGVSVNKIEGEGGRKGQPSYNSSNGQNVTGVVTTVDRRNKEEEVKSDRQQLAKQQQQQNGTLSTTDITSSGNSGVASPVATSAAGAGAGTGRGGGGDCGVEKNECGLGGGKNEMGERNRAVLPISQESSDVVQDEPVENVVHVMGKMKLGTATVPVPASAPIPLSGNNKQQQYHQPTIPEVGLSPYTPHLAQQRTHRKRSPIMPEGSSHPTTFTQAFKVLIPSAVAGCIIGKGGRIICQVQQETGTKIKLSQNHEFFPGTTDRVCLIIGDEENILVATNDILQRVVEFYNQPATRLAKQQNQQTVAKGMAQNNSDSCSGGGEESLGDGVGGKGGSSARTPGYPIQTDVAGATCSGQDDESGLQEDKKEVESVDIKILVPVTAADNLLREGSGALNEALTVTSATCVFASKDESPVPHERVCSLSGMVQDVLVLVQVIFSAMRTNSFGGGYVQISTTYKKLAGSIQPGVGATLLRGGGDGEQSSSSDSHYSIPSRQQQSRIQNPCGGGGLGGLTNSSSGHDMGATDMKRTPAGAYAQQVQQQQAYNWPFYNGGYHVLSQEGGWPAHVVSSSWGQHLMGTAPTSQEQPMYFPYYMGETRDLSMLGMNGGMYPEGPPLSTVPQIIQVQVSIPDFIVGLVLGKRGVNVMRVQKATGARIHISPRGEFVPGTTDRAVVIIGTLQATTAAQRLINQCMSASLAEVYNPEINIQPQQKVLPYMHQIYSSQYDQVGMYPQQHRGRFMAPPPQQFFPGLFQQQPPLNQPEQLEILPMGESNEVQENGRIIDNSHTSIESSAEMEKEVTQQVHKDASASSTTSKDSDKLSTQLATAAAPSIETNI